MVNLKVEIDGNTYPLFIGNNILGKLAEIYKLYGYKSRVAVITDFKFDNRYFKIIYEDFKKHDIEIIPIYIGSQRFKDGLLPVQQIAHRLVEIQFQPDETIFSLGGSYVNNMSAFVAKMMYSGVAYFQIPTTLTAQIILSVDPYCRANCGSVRNLFSIQYSRNLVWNDVALLKSLPAQNLTSGLAYIIQLAYLQDNGLFELLEKNLTSLIKMNPGEIENFVFQCCQFRIDTLRKQSADPNNQQHLYSFGEFIASILLESTINSIKYGSALFIGMFVEGIVAFQSGIFDSASFERLYELLRQVPFTFLRDRLDQQKIIKCLNNRLSAQKNPNLYLPQELGKFILYNNYTVQDILTAFNLFFSN